MITITAAVGTIFRERMSASGADYRPFAEKCW
jgi:hypothetical protein